jgi:hypothetical protein
MQHPPVPAIVMTIPERETDRILYPLKSDTYSSPDEGCCAIPRGLLKVALVPWPSVDEAAPLPASVVTEFVPFIDIHLMRLLLVSAT